MSVVRELVTKLRFVYDNSGLSKLQNGVNQAKSKLHSFAQQVKGADSGKFSRLNAGLQSVRRNVASVTAEWQKQKRVVERAKRIQRIRTERERKENSGNGGILSLKYAAMGYAGIVAGGSVIQVADEWASVSGRIKLATKDAQEHKYAMDEIYNISQRTGQAMAATGDLFQKVARNKKALGLSTDETLKMTEIIGQTLTIGGGDENSNSAGLMQLGQALAAGKISGDELNSVIEQTPRLAEAIAKSFGIDVGQLKEMGKQGKLTAKELAQGLLKQADDIQKEFDQMPKTFSFGMTKMKNAMGRFIAYAVNDVLNLGARFADLAQWFEENIKLVMILAVSAIGGKLMIALKTAQGGIRALGASIWKAMAPMLPWIALFTTIGLIIEDLMVWASDGETQTLAGALFGGFGNWEAQFTQIADMVRLLWSSIKGLFQEISELTGLDLTIEWENWRDVATSVLQYLINGVKGFINLLQNMVRMVRSLIRGDFASAFGFAGDAVDEFSWKFVPFYLLVAPILGKIISAFWLVGKVATTVIWSIARAMFAAMASNPILLAVGIIIAAIAGIIYYWDEIKAVAIAVWNTVSNKAIEIWNNITSFFQNAWDSAIKNVTGMFDSLIPDWVKNLFNGGASVTVNGVDPTAGAVGIANTVSGVTATMAGMSRTANNQTTTNINVYTKDNPKVIAKETAKAVNTRHSGYAMSGMEA
ncbi:putative tail protein [Actinobacillus pleuropneumoniae]|uniref:tape measure protein n=1 Tax=Actinobacillus pleuropneumoniae TaxID=715 RepID=UPI00068CD731|nr:tape measure protein [Actinobacillus pleuropneumoniae]UKH41037.1 tape measure domain-containing protein [Actinobacillus pleuropneumoniae serovar 4 str. M62]SQF64569.1 putative tail protein [Actinobacillus pleuropneumoniae]